MNKSRLKLSCKRWIFSVFFLICCTQFAYAEGSILGYSYSEIFTLSYPDNDMSIKMLQLLFGKVGSSLDVTSTTPTENPVVGGLFRIFNVGVLTMLMLLVFYSIFFQAVNISGDGSQGMSRQSSAFLVFRTVLGSSLLLPAYSGYSGIQVMVMQVVVSGVAFANYAWTQTYQIAMGEASGSAAQTESLETYDMMPMGLTNTWTSDSSGDASTVTTSSSEHCKGTSYVTATDIFAMALCTNLYKEKAESNGETYSYSYFEQTPDTSDMRCSTDSGYYTCFGSTDTTVKATLCGSIKFTDDTAQSAARSAIITAMSNTAGYASSAKQDDSMVTSSGDLTTAGSGIFDCSGIDELAKASSISWPSDFIKYQNTCGVAGVISVIAQKYAEDLISAYPQESSTSSSSSDDNYKSGWATAGQYFQTLSLNIASGNISTTVSSSGAEDTAKDLLGKRGTLDTYVVPYANGSSSNCTANTNPNTPQCQDLCICLDITPTDGSATNENLKNFAGLVLPKENTTYAYYSAAASATVAQAAQEIADQAADSTSSGSSGLSSTTTSVQNMAACNIAASIIQASSNIGNDMPDYLKTSNVMSPQNLGNNSDSTKVPYVSKSVTNQKIDFATTNMMLSVNMVIEALTGMKMFNTKVTSQSTYTDLSNDSKICQTCDDIQSIVDATNGCTSDDFLSKLAEGEYFTMGSSTVDKADLTQAGLFGMVYIEEQGWTKYADPLANLTNLGVTMISSAVFYYTATMQQLFDAIVTISTAYTVIVAASKLVLAGFNAMSAGYAEPLFVSTGALVEGMFQMLFALDKFALELFIPLGTAIAGILFVQGVVLGIFLPFLATIIYLFGVLGWLFSVVEGMVASSLVAMGLTHPEGHDLLGQTEQALMLLLSVFIRPVAMIIGLFFAISVSQATMNLVNTGFLYVMSDYFNTTMQSGGAGTNVGSTYSKVCTISSIGILLVYTYIAYSILEMCYGLISQIPDRILRWIGAPEQQSQATQMAGKIKDSTSGAAREGAGGAGQTTKAPQVQSVSPGINVAGAGAASKDKKKTDPDDLSGKKKS